ncbi:hypothetical protein FEM54_24800 [Pseudomonas edaphica]|uniref:Uncharacterized protein n=3 Tax=Pseudomonas edaphica TaxID=2006980 RepID=A0A5R8QSJ5_9PSED|nr:MULTISPECIES: hypothetical protein [Pseudomonas]MCF5141570.1 hypothetical protein [Pseudomonas sp. PA-6-3C]MCF5148486.1 hypothetical protein [Pseudomonas sp. PA-6-3F]MCF5157259.1 hypothetical protein [Pseudomonas sp. PA-6-2E]MCF5176800.1 hypothetical protein [Pseudomonas sp. PA-6-1D]MCF5191742.1 hypothetical protein [Pseudomonas sp. PA-6-1H]
MTHTDLDSIFSQHYANAKTLEFPAFIGNKSTCNPINSTPYITSLSRFFAEPKDPKRRLLCARLKAAIAELAMADISVEIILIGGSFLDSTVIPGDLDCVLFYSMNAETSVLDLQQWQRQMKAQDLDARLIPMDTHPLIMWKSALFFSVLYTQRKNGDGVPTGLILLDCKH